MKNMKFDTDAVMAPLKTVLSHHAIIVIVVGLLSLSYAVFTINQLLATTDDASYRAQKQADTVKTRFDQDTISKLQRLRDRQQQMTTDLPAGRINPFTE